MVKKRLDIVFCVNKYNEYVVNKYNEYVDYALLLDKGDYEVIWASGDEILAMFNTRKKEREKIAKLLAKYVEVK